MKTRIRTASVAAAVLVMGISVATAGCGKYSFKNLKATKKFEKKHLKGALDNRKAGAKIKQRSQIKAKQQLKKARTAVQDRVPALS